MLNTRNEWTQIVGGDCHTVALTKEGEVFTWGYNHRHIPTKVESLDGLVIVKIACGYNHAVAITDDGDAYTWYVS